VGETTGSVEIMLNFYVKRRKEDHIMNLEKSIQVVNYILQKYDFIRAKADKLSQVK
jgi:hypothetical protein